MKTTYHLTYSPSETTQLASLSSRLTHLESLLGLGLPLTTNNPAPILPTLSHLFAKLTLLTSPQTLDSLSQKLKSLTKDLTTLEEKREQARQRALLDPEDLPLATPETNDSEKINALYACLEQIDKIEPLLPVVLERLRGMSVVHADAADVTRGVKRAGEAIEQMEASLKAWEESLQRVETDLKGLEGRIGGALMKIEELVKGMEERVMKLQGNET